MGKNEIRIIRKDSPLSLYTNALNQELVSLREAICVNGSVLDPLVIVEGT